MIKNAKAAVLAAGILLVNVIASLSVLSAKTRSVNADNDVVLTVAGKQVTLAEFEYSYRKNRSYGEAIATDDFERHLAGLADYKRKVAEAEAEGLDTMPRFRNEFYEYKKEMAWRYLRDDAFIDSIARVAYSHLSESIDVCHIMLPLLPFDEQRQRADSIRCALAGGADFAALATIYSIDVSSKDVGGSLGRVSAGMYPLAFENAAYDMAEGEISGPVRSPFGWHIIKLEGRRRAETAIPTFDELRNDIDAILERNGVFQEAYVRGLSRLKARYASAGGKAVEESEVLSAAMDSLIENLPEYAGLINEFYDGTLLYEISQRKVWRDPFADREAVESYFAAHANDFKWAEPRFKGYVVFASDSLTIAGVESYLASVSDVADELKADSLKALFGRGIKVERVICRKGESPVVDAIAFGGVPYRSPDKWSHYTAYGWRILNAPEEASDAGSEFVKAYSRHLEDEWSARLAKKYPAKINKKILKRIK